MDTWYLNRRKTEKLRFISCHPLCWCLRQTDKIRFISLLILGFKKDRLTTYVSFNPQSTQDKRTIELRQKDKLFFTPDIGIDARPTDGQTMFHFTHYVCIYDRRTKYVSFHSSYLEPSKRDRQKHFISLVILESKKEKLRFPLTLIF